MRRSAWSAVILAGLAATGAFPPPAFGATSAPAPVWTSTLRIPGVGTFSPGKTAARLLADGTLIVAASGDPGIGIFRYDSSGARISVVFVSPPYSRRIAFDPFGGLYVFGTSPANGSQFWLMKYDGVSGRALWPAPATIHNPGSTSQTAADFAVDRNGDVVATGSVVTGGKSDWATFKLDGRSGALVWGPVLFDGTAHADDDPVALALDSAGNAFVTGTSFSAANGDIATIKYAGATGAVLWGPRIFNGPGNAMDQPVAIAVDLAGNLVVTGNTFHPLPSSSDYVTLEYDGSTGATRWGPVFFDAGGQEQVTALALDTRGNVFVTGSVLGSSFDVATLAYDAATGARLWGPVIFDAGPADVPTALATDGRGDLLVASGTGSAFATNKYDGRTGALLWGPETFASGNQAPFPGGLFLDAASDAFVVGEAFDGAINRLAVLKYSGANGVEMGLPSIDSAFGGLASHARGLEVDPAGDIWITGTATLGNGAPYFETRKFSRTTGAMVAGYGVGTATARATAIDQTGNVFVVANGSNGADEQTYVFKSDNVIVGPVWAATFNRVGYDDLPLAVAVDSNGDVLVSGLSSQGPVSLVFTVKYNGLTGALLWGPTLSAAVPALPVIPEFFQRIDSSGDVVVLTDGFGAPRLSNDDFVTVKLSGATGAIMWGPIHFDDGGFALPTGLALDPAGDVFVSGHSYRGSGTLDFVLLKYSGSSGEIAWGPVHYDSGDADARPLLAVDGAGDAYVCGYSGSSTTTIATLKYSGSTGSVLWGPATYSGAATDFPSPQAIAIDGNGNVVIAGRTSPGTAATDFLLLGYRRSDGTASWAPVVTDSGGDDRAMFLRFIGNDPVVSGGLDSIFTVRYTSGLVIATDPALPTALCGVPYIDALAAQNGTAPYTWTTVASFPPFPLDSSGILSGTANDEGVATFRVRVTDSDSAFVEKNFSLPISPGKAFVPVIASQDPVCPGDSVVLSVPGSWYSYHWLRGGETSSTIVVSPTSTADYGVVLTDGSGLCKTFASIRVYVGSPEAGTDAGLSSIAPTSGAATGSVPLSLTGTRFASGGTASVGGIPSPSVSVSSCTLAHATTPALTPGTLNDVVWTNPSAAGSLLAKAFFADFGDVSQASPFHSFIEKLVRHAVTAGCGTGDYCVSDPVTRAQISVFLLRSQDGPAYIPPACFTPPFADVPCSSPFAPWIAELSARGVTAGCGGGNYCPASSATRAQMAVFLLRTKEGAGYVPPPCAAAPFADVPCSSGFAIWIQELAVRGVTAGCGGGNYCPSSAVTRGQMAVFLVTTFGLS